MNSLAWDLENMIKINGNQILFISQCALVQPRLTSGGVPVVQNEPHLTKYVRPSVRPFAVVGRRRRTKQKLRREEKQP